MSLTLSARRVTGQAAAVATEALQQIQQQLEETEGGRVAAEAACQQLQHTLVETESLQAAAAAEVAALREQVKAMEEAAAAAHRRQLEAREAQAAAAHALQHANTQLTALQVRGELVGAQRRWKRPRCHSS